MPHFRVLCLLALLASASSPAHAQAKPPANTQMLDLANPGFETGLTGWLLNGPDGAALVVPEAAHAGKAGLRVTSMAATPKVTVSSNYMSAAPGRIYEVQGFARVNSGQGLTVYMAFFGPGRELLTSQAAANENKVRIQSPVGTFKNFTLRATAPATTASVRVWIYAAKTEVSADFDEWSVTETTVGE